MTYQSKVRFDLSLKTRRHTRHQVHRTRRHTISTQAARQTLTIKPMNRRFTKSTLLIIQFTVPSLPTHSGQISNSNLPMIRRMSTNSFVTFVINIRRRHTFRAITSLIPFSNNRINNRLLSSRLQLTLQHITKRRNRRATKISRHIHIRTLHRLRRVTLVRRVKGQEQRLTTVDQRRTIRSRAINRTFSNLNQPTSRSVSILNSKERQVAGVVRLITPIVMLKARPITPTLLRRTSRRLTMGLLLTINRTTSNI